MDRAEDDSLQRDAGCHASGHGLKLLQEISAEDEFLAKSHDDAEEKIRCNLREAGWNVIEAGRRRFAVQNPHAENRGGFPDHPKRQRNREIPQHVAPTCPASAHKIPKRSAAPCTPTNTQ